MALIDAAVRLRRPAADVPTPEVSIVIPALNEERTVAQFVDWCQEGLRKAGLPGEILIVSSSTDRTDELALSHGARVLRTPRRGLGRAYIDAMPYIRGRYVLIGDADCTYDFREIAPFIDKLRQGYEFVMGSRFRGTIEPGAMPLHHRYFGTPVTNWILNLLFSSHFSDIHCGMRALTREAFIRIDLSSQGWEYASEMILKALHLGLRSCEIPINFYRDRNGRVSTHKRLGFLTPWKAGWQNLRVMFTLGANFFLFGPGIAMSVLGLVGVAILTPGPLRVGQLLLTSNTQFLAVAVAIMGIAALYLGILAEVINDLTGVTSRRWLARFAYDRSVLIAAVFVVAGLSLDLNFVAVYANHRFQIPPSEAVPTHLATTGIFLIMLGFLSFSFTLVLHAAAGRLSRLSEAKAGQSAERLREVA